MTVWDDWYNEENKKSFTQEAKIWGKESKEKHSQNWKTETSNQLHYKQKQVNKFQWRSY